MLKGIFQHDRDGVFTMARHALIIVLCFSFIVLSACGEDNANKSANHLSRSKVYQDAHQYQAALIEAKNAVKQAPTSIEAKLRLAEVLLAMGNAREVIDLLQPIDAPETHQIAHTLIQAQLQSGKFRSALSTLDIYDQTPGRQMPHVSMVQRGEAFLGLKRFEEAARQFEKALTEEETYLPALVGAARVALAQSKLDTADTFVKRALELHSQDTKGLIVSAEIAFVKSDWESAENALTEALANMPQADQLLPEKATVVSMLAEVLTRQGRFAQAHAYTKIIQEANPEAYRAGQEFLQAETLIQSGQYEEAEALLASLQKKFHAPEISAALGITTLATGEIAQAHRYFEEIDLESASGEARRAYALTALRLNKHDKVVDVLEQEIATQPDNPTILSLYGLAAMAKGHTDKGLEAIRKSLAIDPDNTHLRITLAQYYESTGSRDAALAEIQRAYQIDSSNTQVQSQLVDLLFLNGEHDKAKAIAANILQNYPDKASSYVLAGSVLLAENNREEASQLLTKALQLEPDNMAAHYGLANDALKHKQAQRATQHFESIVANDQNQFNAYKGLLTAYWLKGQQNEGVEVIEREARRYPNAWAPKAVLGEYWLTQKAFSKADDLIGLARSLHPGSLYLKQLHAENYYQHAMQRIQQQDFNNAAQLINKAVTLNGNKHTYLATQARIAIQQGRNEDAERQIQQLAKRFPDTGISDELWGDLAVKNRLLKEALSHYESAWNKEPGDFVGAKLASILGMTKGEDALHSFYRDWQIKLPRSPEPDARMAYLAQHAGQPQEAISLYEQAIMKHPSSPAVLNNLAWLYHEIGDNRARETAEKAYELAPDNPAILDTYGVMLVRNGETEKAVSILRKATQLDPDNAQIKQHLNEAERARSAQQG